MAAVHAGKASNDKANSEAKLPMKETRDAIFASPLSP
jgi:hypothetical protein